MTEIEAKRQPAPPGLGPAGRKLWRSIADRWVLDPREVALLAAAAKQADDVAMLEQVLAEDGPVAEGSKGQPRLSMVVAELRQQRLALGKLLESLSLPAAEDEAPRVNRTQQRRASRRWGA